MSGSSQVTDGVISADTPCQRCSYNLRGLSSEGRCPECGQAVGETLFFYTAEIRQAYTHYFAMVRSGLWRACMAAVCVLTELLVLTRVRRDGELAAIMLVPAAIVLTFSAAWRLSAEPPVRRAIGFGEVCRQAMNWSLLAAVAGFGAAWVDKMPSLFLVPLIAFLAGLLLFCGDIAGRLRSPVRRALCCVAAVVAAGSLVSLLLHGPEPFVIYLLLAAFALATLALAAVARLLPMPGR